MFPAAVCAISAIQSPFLRPIAALISCWPSCLLPILHPLLLLLLPCADAVAVPDKRLYSIGRLEYDMFAEHFLLPEDFDLAARTPTRKPSARELDALLNNELFEGDILGIDPQRLPGETRMFFDDDEYELMERRLLAEDQPADIGDDPVLDERRIFPNKLWKGAAVPYMLEEGMTPSQRAAIASAFDEYKGKTCVRFVPRQPGDEDYIYIKRNHAFGCSSYVGRAGGNQTVSLEVDKCFSKGIIAHELMHALGFFHEHSRTDRDEFVEILEQNVRPGMLRNFEKYPRKIIDPLGMPYDYESVMHYHKLAFSRNGRATIVPKKRNAEIGQRYKLSEIDAKKVNKLYRCDDEATVEPTTTTSTMTTVPSTESSTAPPEEEMTTTTADEQQTTSTEPAETPPSTTTVGAEGGGGSRSSSTTTSVAGGGGGGEETPMPGEETTAEATTAAPTEESSTAVDGDEEEENGEGRRLPGPIGIRSQIRERPPGGGSSSGGGGWPAGMARKFITLSIWSTRGGEGDGGNGGNGRDRKSKKSSSGLTRIKVEEKAGGGGGKTDKTSSTSSASRRVVKECLDLNAHCEMWERLGHCVHSPKYMRHYCRKSCGLCDSDERTEQESRLTCTDRNHFCSYWARNGECDNGSKFMKLFCKRSCGLCLN